MEYPNGSDGALMGRALAAAADGSSRGERPHGAVVVVGETVVVAHDESRSLADPTAHAITGAIAAMAAITGQWRLEGVAVIATHEPCAMCAGALVAARVARLVFGAVVANGAAGSRYNVLADPRLGHEVAVESGVLADACTALG